MIAAQRLLPCDANTDCLDFHACRSIARAERMAGMYGFLCDRRNDNTDRRITAKQGITDCLQAATASADERVSRQPIG